MKNLNLLSLSLLCIAPLASMNASAVDLVDSDFSTGTDGWKITKTPGIVAWGGSENQALVYTSTNSYRGVYRDFDSVQLENIGDSITFSFDIRATATDVSSALGLRISVGEFSKMNNTDRGGYVFTTSWGTATNDNWLYSPSAFDGGTATSYGADGVGVGVSLDGVFQNVFMSITRESLTELRFVFVVDGTQTGNKVITATPDVFNMIAIVNAASPNGFDLDNVKVAYQAIPETSTIALLFAIGAFGVVAIRRRRRS